MSRVAVETRMDGNGMEMRMGIIIIIIHRFLERHKSLGYRGATEEWE